MSLYDVSDEAVVIPGLDGAFARRSINDARVLCGCYCWTCEKYSNNPGCKAKESLLQISGLISPKYWNDLLMKGLID